MSRLLMKKMAVVAAISVWSLILVISACGQGQPQETSSTTPDSTTTSSELASTPTVPESFEEVWAASVAAVDALGPVRVHVIRTTEGRVLDEIAGSLLIRSRLDTEEVDV